MNQPFVAKLEELLQASYNLPNAVCDIGRIELGPAELEDITNRVCPHDKGGIDARAHYLLAASGFNAEHVLREIALVNVRRPDRKGIDASVDTGKVDGSRAEANKPGKAGDAKAGSESDKFLGASGVSGTGSDKAGVLKSTPQHPASALSSVDQIVAQSTRDFDSFLDSHLDVDWASRKREITDLLGPAQDAGKANWGRKGLGAQILGSASSDALKMTPLMRAYADIVVQLCDHEFRLPNIVSRFTQAAKSQAGSNGYVIDSWNALELRDPLAFLEKQYRDYIDAEIAQHRQEAKLGGVPSSFNKVKAFVSLKYFKHDTWDSRLTLINKTPIWAYLYYLVRAGYLEEALQLVLERKDIFETMGSSFAVFFKAWLDSPTHTLSPHYAEMIHAEYLQSFRPGAQFDPYKQALYKVIGRADLSKRTLPLVATTTEDWLWLQLRLCRDNSAYTLEDLRSYLLEIGPTYLASDPLKYFTILILLGLYTQAIVFLRSHDEVHTVHYAVALASLGLLDEKASNECDFNGLVGHYTRHFRQSMPNLAVDYIVLISLPGGLASQHSAAQAALQQLVLETRRFSELLGDVGTLTERSVPGSIENRMDLVGLHDKQTFTRVIPYEAAVKADKEGRVVDSILLFRLAEAPQRVLQLVNAQLGLVLSGVQLGQPVPSASAESVDILQLARNMMRIDGEALARSEARETCLVLLAIADCMDLLAKQEWQQCLERISQTGLLVLTPDAAVSHVRGLAQQFMMYDESIARNIPGLLVMAMTCIVKITESLKSSGNPVAGRLLDQYRTRANNCMVHAGLIQFRMPREVYARLTQLEAQMA